MVDFVKLGGESNPLSNEPEENQKGDFVVLKNNPDAGACARTRVPTFIHIRTRGHTQASTNLHRHTHMVVRN